MVVMKAYMGGGPALRNDPTNRLRCGTSTLASIFAELFGRGDRIYGPQISARSDFRSALALLVRSLWRRS
jgi:hypothetical protein